MIGVLNSISSFYLLSEESPRTSGNRRFVEAAAKGHQKGPPILVTESAVKQEIAGHIK